MTENEYRSLYLCCSDLLIPSKTLPPNERCKAANEKCKYAHLGNEPPFDLAAIGPNHVQPSGKVGPHHGRCGEIEMTFRTVDLAHY